MSSRLHEIMRLFGRYTLVAAIFAFWGGICGALVFWGGLNQTVLFFVAIVGGCSTAFPMWIRLSAIRPESEQTVSIWITEWASGSTNTAPSLHRTTTVAQNVLFAP